jgi:Nucleotidyl transferase AbiEii toxin, Type IV TA system
MSAELDVLLEVTRRLDGAGFPYMLTGSMALSYYGRPRMTRDLDLVVEVSPADADRLADALGDDFYLDRDAVADAVASRGIFNAIHSEHVVKVDFVVRKETEYRRLEFARRRRVQIDDAGIFVVAPEDLIVSKLAWARESGSAMQLADVRNLLSAVADLDTAYLEHWVGRLGLGDLYAEVRR